MPSTINSNVAHAAAYMSSATIASAMGYLKLGQLPVGRWLDPHNRYGTDTVARIDNDISGGVDNHTLAVSDMSEYIAASVPLHCFDGWCFLSGAISALLDGDDSTAIHLAYYAELRAAMAFLASQGMGVFKGKHCWFDVTGVCHTFTGVQTHTLVWMALKEWAMDTAHGARLLSLFTVNNISLTDWLNAAGYALISQPISEVAREWLESWSLDLRVLEDDHLVRNVVSYRPQRMLSSRRTTTFRDALDASSEYWQACEPAGSERFLLLDRHLLRTALERTYGLQTSRRPRGVRYIRFIDDTFTNLGLTVGSLLEDFLLRRDMPDQHRVLIDASKGVQARAIIARALLLLRIASASTQELLQQQAVSISDLRFWWLDIGRGMGLWKPGYRPGSMTDLWGDVDNALDEVDQWLISSRRASLFRAREEIGLALWHTAQFQRAGLWGVGL